MCRRRRPRYADLVAVGVTQARIHLTRMSAKHRRRHRSPRPAGENPVRHPPPLQANAFRRKVILLVGFGAIVALGWFAATVWRPLSRAPSQPLAPVPATGADLPLGTRSTQPAIHRPKKDQAHAVQVNLGNELLEQGKTVEAVEMLTEAMRSNPEDEDVHYNLALALTQQGKVEEAIQQYQEALRILPDYVEAHNNLGNLLMRLGRTDDAIAHFEQAIKTMPDYASAHNNLGTAQQRVGRTNDALMHFRQAVKLNPDYWQAHFNVGTSCLQEGRLSEARTEFETVLRSAARFSTRQSSPGRNRSPAAGRRAGKTMKAVATKRRKKPQRIPVFCALSCLFVAASIVRCAVHPTHYGALHRPPDMLESSRSCV